MLRLALAAILIFPSTASAMPKIVGKGATPAAVHNLKLAASHWGRWPDCKRLRIKNVDLPEDQAGAALTCTLYHDVSLYFAMDRLDRCRLDTHELGHLLGYEHEATEVMSATSSRSYGAYRQGAVPMCEWGWGGALTSANDPLYSSL